MRKNFIAEQKYLIVGFVVVVAVFAGLVWASQPGQAPPSASGGPSALTADETRYDFGTVSMASGTVSHRFTFKNTGSSAVTLAKLYTSCMCTTATLQASGRSIGPFGMLGHGFVPSFSQALEPGAAGEIEVVFDPAAHGPAGVGRIDRVVTLEPDAGAPLEFKFTAVVTP